MRKQMKIAAVVSAAALLALGASITSFAAQKGTWKNEDGEWYCYDKNGDVYENTFCLSNGKEFYVGDDGMLATSSWVEDDGDYYFVNSAGQKIVNDWRLTTPYDDDSADEEWYYFQSSGKRAENKKLIVKGKTYFFDGEGTMLTGWVQKSGDDYDDASTDDVSNSDTFYCDETGARLEKAWVKTYAPSVDEDDVDSDEDEYYYYLKSSGKVATGKQTNIKSQTYFFDNEGKMLTGWVAKTDSNYKSISGDDDNEDYFEKLSDLATGADVYYCGEEDDGHMKKNKWIKIWNPKDSYDADDDQDKFWFYIEKSGKVYIPDPVEEASKTYDATRYKLDDGEGDGFNNIFKGSNYDIISDEDSGNLTVTEKKINGKTYFFDQEAQMVTKFVKVSDSDAEKMYYLGGADEGARKDGSISIADESGESYRFYFATDDKTSQGYWNAAGVNGAKNGKLYENGLLVRATDDKYEEKQVTITYKTESGVESKEATFIVNKSGSIQSSDKKYEEDDDVLVDATGWKFNKTKGAFYNSKEQ